MLFPGTCLVCIIVLRESVASSVIYLGQSYVGTTIMDTVGALLGPNNQGDHRNGTELQDQRTALLEARL